MKEPRWSYRLVITLVVLGLILAACGGKEKKKETPAPSPKQTESVEATPAPSAIPTESAAGPAGEQLVSERCTVCHSRDRIDNAKKDEAGWTATVDRMIGKGAQLNADERTAVIAYLAQTHGM